jgi:hypothetical protein
VARSVLRFLQDAFRAQGRDNRADVVCLMTHDRNYFRRPKRLAGPHYMLDKRAPSGSMQHLRHVRMETRTLPGSENYNHRIFIFRGHLVNIVASRHFFGNRNRRDC